MEDWTHRYSAAALGVTANGNVYGRTSASSPWWAVVWSRGVGDPAVYSTVAAFRTGAGQEQAGGEVVTGTLTDAAGRPGAAVAARVPAAIPLDASVAGLLGRAPGLRAVGAFFG